MPSTLGPHRPKVQEALLGAYSTMGSLSEFAQTGLDLNLEVISGANLREKIVNLVTWAQEQGKLSALLVKARDGRPDNLELAAVMDNARAHLALIQRPPWYEPPDPYEACFVRKKLAFLDRRELRDSLRQLADEDGARTLVVGGNARSGRSHSLQLIVFLGERLGTYQHVFVDLQQAGPELYPKDLVLNIAYQLEYSTNLDLLPESDYEQPARQNMALCNWLVGATRGHGHLWVVIDGVDQVTLREDTRDFLERLVRTAETNAPWFRVVLLAYSEPLPPDLERLAQREHIKPINRDAVEDFFALFASHKGIAADARAITAIVDKVMGAVPARRADPNRLTLLAEAVAQAAQKLAPEVGDPRDE